ncbi:MAG TPA: hypothetical protein VKR82_11395 [Candidatus Acidoferrales bacterium]|nr:hypothetical protein [Candidatus Acidoferrales bacterium]
MNNLEKLLWFAAIVQLGMVLANFYLPSKLRYRENLSRVAPMIREIFVVHAAYVVGIVFLFAVLTLRFARDLASGHGLGQFLAASISLFWLCRVPLQLFYYDAAIRRANRAGDVAMIAALLFLATAYGAAALAPTW